MLEFVGVNIDDNIKRLRESFPEESCADLVLDSFMVGKRRGCIAFFNGISNSDLLLKVEQNLSFSREDYGSMQELAGRCVPLTDKKFETDMSAVILALLSAMSVLFVDGYGTALIMDTKEYPSRSIEEPEKNKTMRGPRDGFGESVFINTALIRRRIKSELLSFEAFDVGSKTHTKVVLAYMRDKCESSVIERVRKRLRSIDVPSLTLSQQTLTDNIFSRSKLEKINPFPKVRYVERPDTAASMLMEGKIALLCDTSPSAIFFPVTLYDMMEETDDYYFPPFTASYLRLLRITMLFVSVFLSPLWLLATVYFSLLPPSLEFLLVDSEVFFPVWLQLILVEVMIDALKIASLNTPSTISNSLSVVSGLLLSDFAVTAGILVPQTILYSAISSIANFIPTNYELGYAFKFWRITLIGATAIFGFAGFISATAFFIFVLCSNKSRNRNFLYPFSPADKKGILKFFIRTDRGKE